MKHIKLFEDFVNEKEDCGCNETSEVGNETLSEKEEEYYPGHPTGEYAKEREQDRKDDWEDNIERMKKLCNPPKYKYYRDAGYNMFSGIQAKHNYNLENLCPREAADYLKIVKAFFAKQTGKGQLVYKPFKG